MDPPCKLVGRPQYWDTYWWSRTPAGGNTSETGPTNANAADASGFYATMLANRKWWHNELANEGMMSLTSLPSPASTNGTWLNVQARHNIILGMITWNNKWGSVTFTDLYHTIPYHTIPYHTIPYHTIPYLPPLLSPLRHIPPNPCLFCTRTRWLVSVAHASTFCLSPHCCTGDYLLSFTPLLYRRLPSVLFGPSIFQCALRF